MKKSIYNFCITDKEGLTLIYNSFTNSLIEDTDGRIMEFVNSDKPLEEDATKFSKDELDILQKNGIIEDNNINQKELAIKTQKRRLEKIFNEENKLGFVIAPTMACNFKCFYCFETDEAKSAGAMKPELVESLLEYFQKSIKNGIKAIDITWYGGEPLLEKKLLLDTQKRIWDLCQTTNTVLRTEIISNGVLYDKEFSDKAAELGIERIQVTVDGPEKTHNRRRRYPEDPDRNFQLLMENIKNGNKKINVDIRINIDKTNRQEVYSLINSLVEQEIWPQQKNVTIYPAHVAEGQGNPNLPEMEMSDYIKFNDEVRLFLANKYNEVMKSDKGKLRFEYPTVGGRPGCGYGFTKHLWVMDHKGNLYKCWEALGDPKLIIGHLKDLHKDSGLEISTKNVITYKDFDKWGCFDCKVFPICGLQCPWDFIPDKTGARRCSSWKTALDYRLLTQYKLYQKNSNIFHKPPFIVE